MKMFKASIAAAALSAAIVVTAAPAQAATGWDRCVYGYFCAFTDPNGTGAIAMYEIGDPNLADAYGPQGMNNNIESVWNRDSRGWMGYMDGYGSAATGFGSYLKIPNLFHSGNRISSLRPL